ncbi:hypothetical protein BDQ17DRAFT_662945 [Cyathus striatus]|nr:hypothetical protein BDQ17DRAFT_662945 [Cyathus striatus]
MLRWCRSTISPLDGYARLQSHSVRHHANATAIHQRPKESATIYMLFQSPRDGEYSSASPVTRIFRRVSSKDPRALTETTALYSLHAQTQYLASESPQSDLLSPKETQDVFRPVELSTTPLEVDLPDQCSSCQNQTCSLRDILSLSQCSPTHCDLSVGALDALYNSAKENGQLELFSASQLSSLISVFGTLSLGKSHVICEYYSTLVPNENESVTEANRWRELADVVQLKRKLGFELNMKDRYWILRSILFALRSNLQEPVGSDSGLTIRKQLAEARSHYQTIAESVTGAEFHLLYFTTVLRWPSPARVTEVVHHLCSILDNENCPAQQFPDLLWDMMLKHRRFITLSVKQRVLETLSRRLVKHYDQVRPSARLPVSSYSKLPHREQATATNHIASLFAGCFFPCYRPSSAVPSVERWAFRESDNVCKDHLPIDIRWNNFILLAAALRGSLPTTSGDRPNAFEDKFLTWRTVLILNTLDSVLRSSRDDYIIPSRNLQAILRPLWRSWKQGAAQVGTVSVLRRIATSFLQLAGEASDGPLTAGCFNFCYEKTLFVDGKRQEGPLKGPILDLITAYARAAVRCRVSWPDIFSALRRAGVQRNRHVIEPILSRMVSEIPNQAYKLCIFAHDAGLSPSFHSISALCKILVSDRKWSKASRLLALSQFNRYETQELILSILEDFRRQRTTQIQPKFAKMLGRTVQKLYVGHAPPVRAKWQLRFFLPIAIMSQQPGAAIHIVEIIHRTTPSFFTVRYLLRLLHLLLLHGQFILATRLFQTVRQTPGTPSAIDDFRRKLSLGLAVGGAHRLSRMASRMKERSRSTSTCERLIRVVRFKYRSPKRSTTFDLLKRLGSVSKKSNASNIRHVMALLLKTKRFSLARKLFGKACRHLDQKSNTILGNMILHAPMLRLDHRNRRLVRFVVRTKDFLVNTYGFKPDRTTVNIIMKSVLKWKHLDSSQIKTLFDHMAKQGYLSSKRSSQQIGIPFLTSSSTVARPLNLPTLSPDVSFHKHARPLFKIFIKAFHCRADHTAAQTVIGVLKMEAALAKDEWEKRERARRMGLIKKKLQKLGNHS